MIDLVAQYLFLMFLLLCISNRKLISCMEDGNIENKVNRNQLEALWWLERMQERKVNGT